MAVAPIFSFQTIAAAAEGLYKEKSSKFFAFAYPVKDENEIKAKLEELRKKYFDANHHCYGWRLGPGKNRFRAFDDGEPGHSAGTPILGQIKSKNLTDILVVVVRYFGGTKLGIGGLSQAYKTAAEIALENAKIVEIELTAAIAMSYDYTASPDVSRLIKEFDLEIKNQEYGDLVQATLSVKLKNLEKFLGKLKLMQAMGSKLSFSEEQL